MDANAPHLRTVADLEAVMQAIPEPRVLLSEDAKILGINAAACELLGHAPSDVVGAGVEVLMPDGADAQIDDLRQAWAATPIPGRLGHDMDLRARRADGSEVPIELQVLVWTTDEGDVVVVGLHDLTSAQRDNRLFRALMESAPDPVVITDESGRIRLVNGAAEEAFGYDRGELVGQPMEVLVPDRVAEHHRQLRTGFLAAPHPRTMGHAGLLYARRKDGSEFPADISLAPVATEDGPLVIAAVRDLSERLAALAALSQAQEQQRLGAEVNRVKDQFVATLSHELRTPLAAILGFCELMAEGEQLDPEVRHFVSVVTRNARREARLVEDLLTLVDINGGLSIRAEPTNLTTLVGDAVGSAQAQATSAGIDLSFEGSGEVTIVCDPDRIGQALDNLISNALKFTAAGGTVRVGLDSGDTTASITVSDTGMGIDDPEPSHVFDRLYRSPLAVARAIPGAGVGLSIASAIAEAHHGSLRVVATGTEGTTFAIELPLDGQPEAVLPAP